MPGRLSKKKLCNISNYYRASTYYRTISRAHRNSIRRIRSLVTSTRRRDKKRAKKRAKKIAKRIAKKRVSKHSVFLRRRHFLRRYHLHRFISVFSQAPSFLYRKLTMHKDKSLFLHGSTAHKRRMIYKKKRTKIRRRYKRRRDQRNKRVASSMLASYQRCSDSTASKATHTWLRTYVLLFVALLNKYAFLYSRFEYYVSRTLKDITFLKNAALRERVYALRAYTDTHFLFLSSFSSCVFSTISDMLTHVNSFLFVAGFCTASWSIPNLHDCIAHYVVSDSVIYRLARFFFFRVGVTFLHLCVLGFSRLHFNMPTLLVLSLKRSFYVMFNKYCSTYFATCSENTNKFTYKYVFRKHSMARLFLNSTYLTWLRCRFFSYSSFLLRISKAKSFFLNARSAFPYYFQKHAQLRLSDKNAVTNFAASTDNVYAFKQYFGRRNKITSLASAAFVRGALRSALLKMFKNNKWVLNFFPAFKGVRIIKYLCTLFTRTVSNRKSFVMIRKRI
jgi:hypothetical protein